MTSLGLNSTGATKAEVALAFRAGWLKHVGVVLGGASGAAIVLGAYQVLRAEPEKAFALLQAWGPVFLVAIVAIFILGKFLDGLNSTVRESFSVVASSVQNSAEAAGRTADALTRLADQGGRQAEQVQRLAIYAAQEFPQVYERFDRQDEALGKLAESVNAIAIHLQAKGGSDGSGRT
jgi:hypothetical protein